MTTIDLTEALTPDVEYLDLGSSNGGSLAWGRRLRTADGRGLGVDLDPRKVQRARAENHDVVIGDATQLGLTDAVRFVTMFHFLEHLPGRDAVKSAIESAAQAATDFIYIRHPSFEGMEALEALGLRQYWWHWHGHTSMHTVADYQAMCSELGLDDYVIQYRQQVLDSADPSILSITTPRDSHKFDSAKHPPKPYIHFKEPLWIAQHLWILLRSFSPEEFDALVAKG